MTPAELALHERLQRRADTLSGDMRARLLAAYDRIRESLSERDLADAIKSGRIERILDQLLGSRAPVDLLAPLRVALDRAALDAAARWARDLPLKVAPSVFDVLNPRIIESVRTLDTRVIQGLRAEVRETVRQTAEAGLEAGKAPRAVARQMREAVGLAPNQEEAVRNFRRLLESGDREALTRKLRDRRFDRTLQKALGEDGARLSTEQVDRMTEAYRKRMIAFNAETHARSIALDTQRLAQRNSWENAIAQGTVQERRLRRTWVGVMDSRERPEHKEMEGQTTTWNEPYSNGQMLPGESDFNCRCIERITQVETDEIPSRAA